MRHAGNEAVRLGLQVNLLGQQFLSLGRSLGFVRNAPVGRIDDRALAWSDSGLGFGMILNLENRLIEARRPKALHIGLAIGRAAHGLAGRFRSSIIRPVLAVGASTLPALSTLGSFLLFLLTGARQG